MTRDMYIMHAPLSRVCQAFEEFIRQRCKLQDDTPLTPEMVHRIRCMSRIPFKAIITTNYNSCFNGSEKNVEPALHNGARHSFSHPSFASV